MIRPCGSARSACGHAVGLALLARGTVSAGLFAVASAGCGGSTPAAAVVPKVDYEREGQAKARTAATSSRPLVIEWPAAERARLESSTKRGLVVVHYDESTMEVLARCSAPGSYTYTPTNPQREGVHIHDEDELRANLPLGAASLASRLARSGELTVELSVVGTYETAERIPARAELVGDCAGATHVVVALTTGAFQFYSGGAADGSASAEALGAGAGARSAARRELISEAGDVAACKTSGASDVAPPFGCGALLRVEVERLALRAAVAPKAAEPLGPGASEPAPSEPESADIPSTDPKPAPPKPSEPPPMAPVTPPPEEPRAEAPVEPQPSSMPSEPPPDAGNGTLTTVAIVLGGVLIVGLLIVAPVVAAVTDTPVEPREPAPAGLGKAGVSTPLPGVGAWRF